MGPGAIGAGRGRPRFCTAAAASAGVLFLASYGGSDQKPADTASAPETTPGIVLVSTHGPEKEASVNRVTAGLDRSRHRTASGKATP